VDLAILNISKRERTEIFYFEILDILATDIQTGQIFSI
jgi:hypothetical protein